ncbi:hypothetical protein [Treponema pedis]|uniref:hypothetical protein n=1 Tax=Treponema pedis TaxID=409322 RepID=UPI00040D8673|nr:hypothetical protein [Treponema pedis]
MKEYNLYAPLKPTKGLKDFSYAQDFLLTLLENRELRTFSMKNNVSHTEIYRMGTGERQPGYDIMLALRLIIPPIWWFTSMLEKKPQIKKLKTVSFKGGEQTYKNSIAYKSFFETKTIEWLVNNGFDYQFSYRLKSGKIKFITFNKMQELSLKIHPSLWFIFEGEI